MTWSVAVLVILGGGVGAVLRFLVDGWVGAAVGRARSRRSGTGEPVEHSPAPWGTFVINVTGSFLLGVLVGLAGANPDNVHLLEARQILGTGILGGYTTFSTASLEVARLAMGEWAPASAGALGRAAGHAVGMLVAGVLASALGVACATLVGH